MSILTREQLKGNLAIADTITTSYVLAKHSPQIVNSHQCEQSLQPLPLKALIDMIDPYREPAHKEIQQTQWLIGTLEQLGLKCLGDFARIPISAIGPRFGSLGIDLHKKSRGAYPIALKPFTPEEVLRTTHYFEHPITSIEPLLFAAKSSLHKLNLRLNDSMQVPLEISLFLETTIGQELELKIPLFNPIQQNDVLLRIIADKLNRFRLPDPIIAMSIDISKVRTKVHGQLNLFDHHPGQQEHLKGLLARLYNTMSPTTVYATRPTHKWKPEQAWERTNYFHAMPNELNNKPKLPHHRIRPTHLLDQPKIISMTTTNHRITIRHNERTYWVNKLEGPEKMSGDWWTPDSFNREYFVAYLQSGQLLWIFKDMDVQRYFLHGYFD